MRLILSTVLGRIIRTNVTRHREWVTQHRLMTSQSNHGNNSQSTATDFDEKMLEVLVCPLTKQPLRYDKEKNCLVSDSIQVAYPIVNGIPNLVPQDGQMIQEPGKEKS